MVTFRDDVRPPLERIIDLYCAAPLYRPIDDLERMRRMLDCPPTSCGRPGTAIGRRHRRYSPMAPYTTSRLDLAVHPSYQRAGIGHEFWSASGGTTRKPR